MSRASRSHLGLATAGGMLATSLAVAQTVQPTTLQVDTVVSGLNGPTAMAFLGPNDILVTQKDDGRVRRAIGGVLQSSAVLDVHVNTSSERGLLAIALDPDFVHNSQVYLLYSEASGADDGPALGNRVYRYTWNGSALVTPRLVLDLPIEPGPFHDGGVILFGPDDRLYVVIGDLDRDGQLQNNPTGAAPDNTSVILRVDRAGRGPIDNPFYDPALPQSPLNRYYAYGIRNSFGLTFDPVTGALWDTENGPERMDEVNRVPAGFNSGWRPIMGPVALSGANESDLWQAPGSAYSDPEFSWESTIAPTALAFVASKRLGCALEHRLLVGNFNCDSLQRFELDAARTGLAFGSAALQDLVANNPSACSDEQAEIAFGTGFGIVTDIENGVDGFVYVLSLSRGAIYRIRPQAVIPGDLDADLVPGSCDCDDAAPGSWAAPSALQQLRVSSGAGLQLSWDDVSGIAGSATTYDVVSGSLAGLRASGGFGSACTLGADLAARATTDVRANPAAGDAYYYLVRAGNACAPGTYGDSTLLPDPRDGLDASSPPACI